ncbi:hypothetical protein R0G64_32815, partial [Pseudomonas otitidis]|nr:hypothetical protein [Pseudomonas otitidis]
GLAEVGDQQQVGGQRVAVGELAQAFGTAGEEVALRQVKDVINNREDRLPEVGRYNAGQKILFWFLLASM